jgi:hypothetical protein
MGCVVHEEGSVEKRKTWQHRWLVVSCGNKRWLGVLDGVLELGSLDIMEWNVICHYCGQVGRNRCNLFMYISNECVRAPLSDLFYEMCLYSIEM